MDNWEEIGRKMDREFSRIRELLEKEIKPQTSQKAADALRAASKHLAAAADQIEARIARSAAAPDSAGRADKK
ncbi:MAG TPA: hypothetical protein VEH50_14265 [Methylomirabilota bacterium]|jgi:hypothetical protein|nr:hypothetical protein [Methylomirabilota bacterium]